MSLILTIISGYLNIKVFSSEANVDIKYLSLEVKKISIRNDILWVSKDFNPIFPIFYSDRKTWQITNWNDIANYHQTFKRTFMILNESDYIQHRNYFKKYSNILK